MVEAADLTDRTYGELAVLKRDGAHEKSRHARWLCTCSCGNLVKVLAYSLISGNTKSCGCLRGGKPTHGQSDTPEYRVWCRLGRKGAKEPVCEAWGSSFPKFLADIGKRPTPKHNFIRLDPNKGFTKENCEWSLSRTSRKTAPDPVLNKKYRVGHLTLTLYRWSEVVGIHPKTLLARLNNGWTTRRTMETTLYGRRKAIRKNKKPFKDC